MAEAVNITLKSRLDPKGFEDTKAQARSTAGEVGKLNSKMAETAKLADSTGKGVVGLGRRVATSAGLTTGPLGELAEGLAGVGLGATVAGAAAVLAFSQVKKAAEAADEAVKDLERSEKGLAETQSKIADTVLGGVAKGQGLKAVSPLIAQKQSLESRVADPDTEEAARIVAKREIEKLEKAIAAALSGEAEATGTAARVSAMDKKTGNAAAVAKARFEKQVMEAPTSSIPQVQADLERAQGRLLSADTSTEAGQQQATQARQAIESAKEILEILNRKLEKEKEIQRALEVAGDAVYEKEKERKEIDAKATSVNTGLASASARIGGFNSAMGYITSNNSEKTLSEVARNTAQTAKNTAPRPVPTNASPLR